MPAQIFTWKNPNLPSDSTAIKDSVIASKLNREFYARDTADFIGTRRRILIDDEVLAKNHPSNPFGNLNPKGSIIRGISFGNNQGSAVQSSMDLQLTGQLSPDVSILASISDHNLPIQADGYTQTLQEFDKVYLQLNIKDKTILRAGHLDLVDNESFFSRYQRRTMGLQSESYWIKNGNRTDVAASIGVARSEFHRIRFQGIEGNQGPYRLTGKNGELFISIISGSEQVYIDGLLMQRGENRDYVINYNTGEITFTGSRPIFRQNFITVSYNYANRNYARYLVTAGLKHKRERMRLAFDVFSENDSKNAPLQQELRPEEIAVLAAAGNDPNKMFAPSSVPTEFDVNKVLYRLVNDAGTAYYEYSTDPEQQLYSVAFTFFGEGKGDYRIRRSDNNGRIFEYVGSGAGDYAAVRKLIAPVATQIYSASAEYELNDGVLGADVSLSNFNENLFSRLDARDNVGYATRIFGRKKFFNGDWTGTPSVEYQLINKNFHILDRIHNVEFWRDFNLPNEFNGRTQHRLTANFLNKWAERTSLDYRLNYLQEEDFYKGLKNDVDFAWRKDNFNIAAAASYLDTRAVDLNTKFARGSVLAERRDPRGSWAAGAAFERNNKVYNATATADLSGYGWKELSVQRKIADSLRQKFLGRIYLRSNDSIRDNRLSNVNNILGLQISSEIIKSENTQLSAQLHYRHILKTAGSSSYGNQDFVIGNLTFSHRMLRGGLRLQVFYELGNGQEAQREFQYLKVPDGQGVYKWTDYNGDGVQQLDEFEIAEYADQAQYIRIYTNTIRYLPSNKNKIQAAVFVVPSSILDSENAFLKRWNFNFSLLSENAYFKRDKVLVWNPFHSEEQQILKNQNVLASAQFNPTEASGWNGSYRYNETRNVIYANFSQEKHGQQQHHVNAGYFFNKDLRVDWQNAFSINDNHSQLFLSRNYRLQRVESRPKLTYRFTDAIQADIQAAYRNTVRTDGEDKLTGSEVGGSLQWERPKTTLRGSFSFINNKFNGNSFSFVGNQMLEGLKPGKNQLWSLTLQQALNAFLQLNISYDGRSTAERTIHTGSVQVRASF